MRACRVGHPKKCVLASGGRDRLSTRSHALDRGFPEARKKFWLDRARTAAISKHTNAFKINEDVVIPLNRMG